MNIAGFFADVASAFRDRYLDLTKDMQAHRTPSHFKGAETTPEASQPPVAAEPVEDARVLKVRYDQGGKRRREFVDAIDQATETA